MDKVDNRCSLRLGVGQVVLHGEGSESHEEVEQGDGESKAGLFTALRKRAILL